MACSQKAIWVHFKIPTQSVFLVEIRGMEIRICLYVAGGVCEKSIPTEITALLKFSVKFCGVPEIISNPKLQCSDNTEKLPSVFWTKTIWAFSFYI